MSQEEKKIFILDTNVILHDYKAIFSFQENDVVLPITVLEELDRFKKGSDLINFHAREFMRELDKLSGEQMFQTGVSLGAEMGLLYIVTGKKFSPEMEDSFAEKTADHRILAVTDFVKRDNPTQKVILVTKDMNLRMKAKSLGIFSQDYETGKVRNIAALKRGIQEIENCDDELVARLYRPNEKILLDELHEKVKLTPNQYLILKGNKSSALARYDASEKIIERVEKHRAYGISPRNAEQTFSLDALLRPEIQVVALTGKAGTGKTLLALAAAIQQQKVYHQILLARPIVSLSNRDLGYLPGDVKDKIGPYMQPLYDNLSVIKHQFNYNGAEVSRIDEMLNTEKLVISPLAYIRGRSLANVFFIVDEAQNLTPHEIKTIITRAGEGAKMVFTGDIQQIDSPYLDTKSNGLAYMTERLKGHDIFAHINLVKGERSQLADLASDLL